ncbi:MAG TPA: NADH-quinone oxidoreductase subunit N [Thermomicrobiales bacterium]|nr:NADH-quinone oxidoreductase subunit N [Thermomicrobiales bacterium]
MPQIFEQVNPDLSLAIPQLIVLGLALLLLVADIAIPRARHGILTWITLAGFAAALVATLYYVYDNTNDSTFTTPGYGDMFLTDGFSIFISLVVLTGGILSVMISGSYLQGRSEDPGSMPLAEYYILLSLSVLGTMITGSAGDLLMVFLGIEMSSLAVYALTAFARHRTTSLEGALKYFLLGLFASAFLVYGMAWIYGATGTTNLDGIAVALSGQVTDGDIEASLLLALLLLVVGFGFKVAAVPFHMWTPDAYQGAPTPVSAYMSVIPKVAGFAAMIRVLVQGLAPLSDEWITIIAILAVLTMAFGNIVAVSQRDVKRMLAYSSIGHTGYILAGVAAFSTITQDGENAISSVLYYLFAYAFMNIGAFAVVTWLQHQGYGTTIDDFNGLGTRSPLAALAMTIFMLSLMGLPPLVGFYGKYYVILATIEADMIWLAIAIVLASAVSAFYYLRVVAAMYFSEAPEGAEEPSRTPMLGFGVMTMAVGTIAFGLFSGQIADIANRWVQAFSISM